MKKEYYEKPEMEVIEFDNEDIVKTSTTNGGASNGAETGGNDDW